MPRSDSSSQQVRFKVLEVDKLHKIHRFFPEALVVIRMMDHIAVDDSKLVCCFNSKFGALPREWDSLLKTAKEVGVEIAGFSFHVCSQGWMQMKYLLEQQEPLQGWLQCQLVLSLFSLSGVTGAQVLALRLLHTSRKIYMQFLQAAAAKQ